MKKILIALMAVFLLASCTSNDTKDVDNLKDEYGMTRTSTIIEFIIDDASGNKTYFGKEQNGYNLIYIQLSESGSKEEVLKEVQIGDKIEFDTVKSFDSRVKNIDINGDVYGYITYLECENFAISE